METVTVNGTTYRVISRKADTQVANMRGFVSLVKVHGGRHIFKAVELADGRIGRIWDTKTLENGSSASKYGARG